MLKPTATLWQPSLPALFKITVLGSALATLGLAGCSSTPSSSNAKKSKQVGSGYLDANSLDGLEDLLSATDMRAVEGDRLLILKHGDVWKRMTVGFKMDLNHQHPRINAQRAWFVSRQPYIDRLSARASRYLYYTVKEAERRGIPTELALLPIIESSYDPAATSSAAAAGLWQFIPSTGRIYGLQQNSGYDGRRDVVESTRAAYEFLSSLYNQFGSWELALASYNAGPGRIQQAINRNRAAGLPTDYWSLRLPEETMNYVPRFLAVAQIIKNPNQYGVSLPPIANRPHFREVSVGPASLNDIASVTGLSRAELYQLNPGHRGERIDTLSPMRILIPADISPAVDERLKKLQSGGSASLWVSNGPKTKMTASEISPSKNVPPALNTHVITPSKATPPALEKPVSKVTPPAVVTAAKVTENKTAVATPSTTALSNSVKQKTPSGSSALAAFASQSELPIPSAPRIPVAVSPVTPVAKPISVEPAISAAERAQLQAALKADEQTATVEDVLEPVATVAEKAAVVKELTAIAPVGTEITDPYDGKIKLTAIQTSQSIAEQQGKELTKGFAYPKGLAETIQPDSVEAQMNKGKNVVKTESDVVVVAPKGKRTTYTVISGDTLALIAAKNGLNWRDIAKWNQIDPAAPLYAGNVIYLYDAKPAEETAKTVKPENYVVQTNDSLTSVANQFGLTVKQLADFNGLSVNSGLMVGQKLSLKETAASRAKLEQLKKTESPAVETKATVQTKAYNVKPGEYLKLIADRFGLSNAELAALTTGLTPNSSLMVGQKINVPIATVEEVNAAPVVKKVIEQKVDPVKADNLPTENYAVKRGDTLYSIANQNKMTVAELAALNGLSTNNGLQAGQQLKVPAGSQVPEQYTVQSGDTLSGIANKYNLTIDQIAALNGLSRSSSLRVGQKLKLTSEIESKVNDVKPTTVPTGTAAFSDKEIHVVKSGETLSAIARQYYLQLQYLADLNGISVNSPVRIGQKLKVGLPPEIAARANSIKPAAANIKITKSTETYTVKAGESLNAIANRMKISTAELASLNNLNAQAGLRVGQTLNIPKVVNDYTIKRGDTLIGVASRYGIETDALAKMNDLQPNAQLRIGDVIKVPN